MPECPASGPPSCAAPLERSRVLCRGWYFDDADSALQLGWQLQSLGTPAAGHCAMAATGTASGDGSFLDIRVGEPQTQGDGRAPYTTYKIVTSVSQLSCASGRRPAAPAKAANRAASP